MSRIFTYYSRYQSAQGRLTALPSWARMLVLLAAVPGLILLALSLVAMGVSILALLVLALPAYRLLSAVMGVSRAQAEAGQGSGAGSRGQTITEVDGVEVIDSPAPQAGRRPIEVRIVEEGEAAEPRGS